MAGLEIDLLSLIVLFVGWVITMVFVMFFVINKPMRYELLKTFDKKTPRVYVVTPSRRIKKVFGKWADDRGKKLSLGFVRSRTGGRPEEKLVDIIGNTYLEDGSNAPAIIYKQGASINSDILADTLPDQESDSIAFNRIWENALLWKSLTSNPAFSLDKILLILVIILIVVAAFSGIISWQVLDYLSRLPAEIAKMKIAGLVVF